MYLVMMTRMKWIRLCKILNSKRMVDHFVRCILTIYHCRPCILIFDSLAGTSRTRVVATLRDYLTCEYRSKLNDGNSRVFNKDNMPNYTVKVPQQNNFTDCGLFLLQYVEQFFKVSLHCLLLLISKVLALNSDFIRILLNVRSKFLSFKMCITFHDSGLTVHPFCGVPIFVYLALDLAYENADFRIFISPQFETVRYST